MYRTAPQGLTEQEDFLNAVGKIETNDPPKIVKEKLSTIETALGKIITKRFGPRTIDLDILLYDELVQANPELTIPHPRMHERRFVLQPLSELMGMTDLHPLLKVTYKELLSKTEAQGCTVTDIEL